MTAKNDAKAMLISEFSEKSGLPVDTVRFYIRKGLLKPSSTMLGGSRPYQLFHLSHLRIAEWIRIGRALGLTLDQIGAFVEEHRSGSLTRRRSAQLLRKHRHALQARVEHLNGLLSFLDAKVLWLEGEGDEPQLDHFIGEEIEF